MNFSSDLFALFVRRGADSCQGRGGFAPQVFCHRGCAKCAGGGVVAGAWCGYLCFFLEKNGAGQCQLLGIDIFAELNGTI